MAKKIVYLIDNGYTGEIVVAKTIVEARRVRNQGQKRYGKKRELVVPRIYTAISAKEGFEVIEQVW